MTWTVQVHAGAAKQLKAISPDRRKRIIDDLTALQEDPFRGLVKRLQGKAHKALIARCPGRYRIIFKVTHVTHVVEVLAILIRNEATYR